MLTVMDMSSGKIIEDEFGSFEDEVLNAGWVPQPEVQLGLQDVQQAKATAAPTEPAAGFDADTFLNTVYSSQE